MTKPTASFQCCASAECTRVKIGSDARALLSRVLGCANRFIFEEPKLASFKIWFRGCGFFPDRILCCIPSRHWDKNSTAMPPVDMRIGMFKFTPKQRSIACPPLARRYGHARPALAVSVSLPQWEQFSENKRFARSCPLNMAFHWDVFPRRRMIAGRGYQLPSL